MKTKTKVWLILGLFLFPATPVTTQDRPPKRAFSDSLDVSVVNVDVSVTDKDGRPLTSLTGKDFQLFEDKKKVKITNFYEARPGGSHVVTSLIVYVDNLNLIKTNRNAVLRELGRFLRREMSSGRLPVMVVAFDGRLRVQQELTTDPALVAAALNEIEHEEIPPSEVQALERTSVETVRQTLELLSGNARDERLVRSNLDGIFSNLRGYGEAVHRTVNRSSDAVGSLAAALSVVPGRKAFLYVGGGLPLRPLDELVRTVHRHLSGARRSGAEQMDASRGSGFHQPGTVGPGNVGPANDELLGGQSNDSAVSRLQQAIQVFDSTPQFQRLAAVANTNRVTFYPILPPLVDASSAGLGNRATETSTQALSDVRSGLDFLALATGGTAMLAGVGVAEFLDRARADFDAYYSLGFEPKSRVEGEAHTVEVRVKGRRARLRYRQRYVYKSYLNRLADRTVGALVLDWATNPHEMEVDVQDQKRTGDGNFDVSLMVAVPIAKLTLVPAPGYHHVRGKVVVAVLDSEGRIPAPQHHEIPLQIADADVESAREQFYGAVVHLRLPRGEQKVAVGLWDESAQEGSFLTRTVQIGPR